MKKKKTLISWCLKLEGQTQWRGPDNEEMSDIGRLDTT